MIYGDDVRRKAGGRNDDRKDDRRDRDRRGDDRGDDDRGDDDRRDDDRRRDAACDEKDRRKGECTYDRGRGDGPYPERNGERYPDRAGNPSNRDYPRTLPDMMLGVGYGRGERLNEVRQWLGAEPVRARVTDVDRNGSPEVVVWSDSNGRLVQQWIDDNRDGRADRVVLYQNNRVLRVIQ